MNKKGFTIIEVVLVLAVAGLIFLIVFMALPALQVSSRDTQRREHIMTLVSKIKDFQTNNRGALPSGGETVARSDIDGMTSTYTGASETSWIGFYRDYIGKSFRDPLGETYSVVAVTCGAKNADQECTAGRAKNVGSFSFSEMNYTIVVVTGATCYGDKAVATASPRKVAALYKLEGAGAYCHGT